MEASICMHATPPSFLNVCVYTLLEYIVAFVLKDAPTLANAKLYSEMYVGTTSESVGFYKLLQVMNPRQ